MTPPLPDGVAVVDCHAHLAPKELLGRLYRGQDRFPNVAVTAHEDTYRVAFNAREPTRPIAAGLTDLDRRSAWLGDNGIDAQLAGGWLDIFGYELPADEGADWAEALTTALRESVNDDGRLVVLSTVPLQDPARAAESLRRERAAGSPGVMIATRAAGRELDDPAYASFWEAADETDSVVFLHPGFGGASDRYRDFGLVNGLARLEDTTVSLARLLYRGIPAKYPRMKLIIAHGGAALPYVLGRLVHNHLVNPSATSDPLESFAHLYFDSVIFDPRAMSFLVGKVGPERILLGSDYPFPIGDLTPRDLLAEIDIADNARGLIEGRNARRLVLGECA